MTVKTGVMDAKNSGGPLQYRHGAPRGRGPLLYPPLLGQQCIDAYTVSHRYVHRGSLSQNFGAKVGQFNHNVKNALQLGPFRIAGCHKFTSASVKLLLLYLLCAFNYSNQMNTLPWGRCYEISVMLDRWERTLRGSKNNLIRKYHQTCVYKGFSFQS